MCTPYSELPSKISTMESQVKFIGMGIFWCFFLIFLFGGRANLSTYSGMLGLRKSFIIKQCLSIKPYENLTSLIHNICLSGSCRVMGTRRIDCKDWIKEGEVCKKHNCCYDNFFKMCYHKKEGM